MIADTELGKLGGEIDRVAGEKVSVNAIQRAIDLKTLSASRPHTIDHHTDQECDVSIPEEICVVPRERVVSRRVGGAGSSETRRVGFEPTGLWHRGFGGSLRHRHRGRILQSRYRVDGNDGDGTRTGWWLGR